MEDRVVRNHLNSRSFSTVQKEYIMTKFLGQGAFGKVYQVSHRYTGGKYALKVLKKSHFIHEAVVREISNQRILRHRNVLQLINFFQDPSSIYLVLEYIDFGSLRDHLQKAGRFYESTAAQVTFQVASGLLYCHRNNVMHRDLKPDNLLISQHGEVKIADFGISAYAGIRRWTFCGTSEYMAPEIYKGDYDYLVDNWSLGVVLYEMLVGRTPFSANSRNDIARNIMRCSYSFPRFMCPGGKDLILRLLRLNPNERIDLQHVRNIRWIGFFRTYPIRRNAHGCIR